MVVSAPPERSIGSVANANTWLDLRVLVADENQQPLYTLSVERHRLCSIGTDYKVTTLRLCFIGTDYKVTTTSESQVLLHRN